MPHRIAVLKPDYGSSGGFERHLEGLLDALSGGEWHFEIVSIPVERRDRVFGIRLDRPIRDRHDEYFLWASLVERVQRLDLSAFDAVITTQPPTYLADHPRKLALFYHHARHFYDQAELFAASGFVDPTIHAAAVAAVRSVEASAPSTIGHWLAGSDEIAGRLRTFWEVPEARISIHSAPPTSIPTEPSPYDAAGPALVVGRLEWPKRQELAIAAAWVRPNDWPLEIVGTGSRLGFARRLDAALAADPEQLGGLDDRELWMNTADASRFVPDDAAADRTAASPTSGSPVEFLGAVDDAGLSSAYRRSSMVITPTSHEDYGLTVLEAMAHARPVIVCRDGGGLTEFVEHGSNGLIVDPTPQAIADAVREIRSDPTRAEAMGRRGRETVAGVTWERAVENVADGLRRVLATTPTELLADYPHAP